MPTPTDSLLLRIYIGEAARHNHQPLHEAIVLKAREAHLAGATVIRGAMGYGKSSLLHTTKILRLSDDLPVVIEILDSEEKINAFLPVLEQMMPAGVATLGKVRTMHFGGAKAAP
jgi:PII-like signaling protein